MAEPASSSPARARGGLIMTLAVGLAGGLIAPLLYPTVARNARPVAKRTVKAGIAAFESAKVVAAEFGEQASDLVAEARAEYDEDRKAAASYASATPRDRPNPSDGVVPLRGSAAGEADD